MNDDERMKRYWKNADQKKDRNLYGSYPPPEIELRKRRYQPSKKDDSTVASAIILFLGFLLLLMSFVKFR